MLSAWKVSPLSVCCRLWGGLWKINLNAPMFSYFIKVLMSILSLCLYTMRFNLQFRWFPHTKQCLWEITRCYIFYIAKHSNLKAEEVEFTVWRSVNTGDTSQLIKWLPTGEKIKISPNLNDTAWNHLATHKWPLSAIKMLFTLHD